MLSSKRSTDVMQRTNMEKTSLACCRHLLIKGHFWVEVNTQIFNWCLKLNRRASNRDCSNRLSQSSKRFGSGVVKGDGLWLGWVQVKTIIQKPVVNSLSARFNWSNLSSQRWRVGTYIKLSVISILMEGHCVILVWLIRIYYICDWRNEKNKKQWSKNRAHSKFRLNKSFFCPTHSPHVFLPCQVPTTAPTITIFLQSNTQSSTQNTQTISICHTSLYLLYFQEKLYHHHHRHLFSRHHRAIVFISRLA